MRANTKNINQCVLHTFNNQLLQYKIVLKLYVEIVFVIIPLNNPNSLFFTYFWKIYELLFEFVKSQKGKNFLAYDAPIL